MKKRSAYSTVLLVIVFLGGILSLSLETIPTAYGELFPFIGPQKQPSLPLSQELLSQPVFRENEQSNIEVNSVFADNSTNIIFYIQCPSVACPDDGTKESPVYLFNNETLARGDLPFSEYWVPPALTEYIAIEYKNDKQQFSCSGVSLDACLTDPHFIKKFHFELVDNNTVITAQMLLPESISSDLANGEITTASIDGQLPQIPLETNTLNPAPESLGSFVAEIFHTIFESIFPEKIEPVPTVENLQQASDEQSSAPVENTIPSSLSNEPNANETITTEF